MWTLRVPDYHLSLITPQYQPIRLAKVKVNKLTKLNLSFENKFRLNLITLIFFVVSNSKMPHDDEEREPLVFVSDAVLIEREKTKQEQSRERQAEEKTKQVQAKVDGLLKLKEEGFTNEIILIYAKNLEPQVIADNF
jgi:hypothetical protein